MSITTEYIALQEHELHEHQLVDRLEQRRRVAARGVERHGGERLALIAALARRGRRAAAGHVAG